MHSAEDQFEEAATAHAARYADWGFMVAAQYAPQDALGAVRAWKEAAPARPALADDEDADERERLTAARAEDPWFHWVGAGADGSEDHGER